MAAVIPASGSGSQALLHLGPLSFISFYLLVPARPFPLALKWDWGLVYSTLIPVHEDALHVVVAKPSSARQGLLSQAP